jgi:acetyltransferase
MSHDQVVILPPLSPQRIREAIAEHAPFPAWHSSWEQEFPDLDALQQFLMGFGRLVAEQRWIKEVTLDPLLVAPERVLALDARVVLHDANLPEEHLPRLVLGTPAANPGGS